MTSLAYQPNDDLEAAICRAQSNASLLRGTVRCQGPPAFRTQLARDLGCLLDINDEVDAWSCLAAALGSGEGMHIPDSFVRRGRRHTLVDAGPGPEHPWLDSAASVDQNVGKHLTFASDERIFYEYRYPSVTDIHAEINRLSTPPSP